MIGFAVVPMMVSLVIFLWTTGTWFGGLQASFTEQITKQVSPVATKVAEVSNKVDAAAKDGQVKVDTLSAKIDAAATVAQVKSDALSAKVDSNIAEQVQFRATVRDGFAKVYENQQKATEAIQQEKIDRLTDGKKK